MSGVYRFLLCVSATAGTLALGPAILMVLNWAAPGRRTVDPFVETMIVIAGFTLALVPLLMAISIPVGAIRRRVGGNRAVNSD